MPVEVTLYSMGIKLAAISEQAVSAMKRLAILSALALIMVAIAAIATPWLLSSGFVKERIAARIEELTGLETTLKGEPKLSFVPFLGIKLNDVVVASPPDMARLYGDEPLVSMSALKGNLRLLPAIFGRPELANFKLIRPQFDLKVTPEGSVNWFSNAGAFSRLLLAMTKEGDEDGSAEHLRLGNFQIVNGAINYQNDQSGHRLKITSLNVEISWPRTDGVATVTGSMVWQGEVVEFALRTDTPLDLLTGGASDIIFNLKSNSLEARIEGKADRNISSQFVGTVNITSPSVRQFLAWIGYDLSPGSTPGELKLTSKLLASASNLKFQDASISMDGNTGTGFIDMSISDKGRVGLSGTLALDALNFDPYFQAILKGSGDATTAKEIAEIGLIDKFDLDLRFSAKTAVLGDLSMTSMAATVQARDGNLILDVGEATIFDGMIQAQLQASKEDGLPAGEVKLNLVDIDLDQLSQIITTGGIKIIGRGTATVSLKSKGRNASQLMRRLNGNTTLSAVSGRLEGLNIAEIAIDGENSIILDNTKVLAKTTEFSKLEVGMHIANGIAFFQNSRVEGERLLAKIGGKVDLWRSSLAMNGRVLLSTSKTPDEKNPQDITHNIPFFVGGTLDAPLFAPDLFSSQTDFGSE